MKYVRAQQDIIDLISKRYNTLGVKLPNEAELSAEIGVSIITTRRALAELLKHGIVERIQGKGTFVKKLPAASQPIGDMAFIVTGGLDAFYLRCFVEAQKEAEKRAYRLKLIAGGYNPDAALPGELKGIKGIIIIGKVSKSWVDFLESMTIPFVIIGGCDIDKKYLQVDFDWASGAKNLTLKMISDGHKKIGLLNGSKDYLPAGKIYKGYCQALKGKGIPVDEKLVTWIPHGSYFKMFADFFTENSKGFDALILEQGCFNSFVFWWYQNVSNDNRPALGIVTPNRWSMESTEKIYLAECKESLVKTTIDMLFEEMGNTSVKNPVRLIKMLVK